MSFDQFHAPYTVSSQFNLAVLAAFDIAQPSDPALERRRIHDTAKRVKHLRDAVISEDGECLNIVKPAIAFSIEAGPQICNEYLCSFVESYTLSMKAVLVAEAWKVFN